MFGEIFLFLFSKCSSSSNDADVVCRSRMFETLVNVLPLIVFFMRAVSKTLVVDNNGIIRKKQ